MSTGDEMKVVVDELTTHAGHLGDIEGRLGTALSAARQVSMDNDAYGVLGQPFAWMLDPFEPLGSDMISAAQDVVTNHIESLKKTAQAYTTTEGATRDTFAKGGPA
ncbi:type VII secretion target [Actinocrispum wychmicini]|uniref:Excreted virulence factor EspC (Type VII ESX diderm) n=1 Tax=Actinocrispum wychmicini TaxID=1213861 RepID=A0A4V2S535_9PSEU|nr:type VII secretion target [Actinocrispum wychmicini]TCO50670.1 excreted virulence factor EspC (type VII ESX diderm) [Actinocrispum wychmicini]